MLKVENLSTSYKTIDGDIHVLNDINFEIHDMRSSASQANPDAAKPLC
jgi:ABC-type dipeptide/oligopeptide/nickel transport system ATPase component